MLLPEPDGVACARFYGLAGDSKAYTGPGQMEMYDSWLDMRGAYPFFERENGVWRAEIEDDLKIGEGR